MHRPYFANEYKECIKQNATMVCLENCQQKFDEYHYIEVTCPVKCIPTYKMCDGVLDFFNLGMFTNKMSILTIFDHKCFKHKFDQIF